MNKNGYIKLSNKNKNINLIQINDLENNDSTIINKDLNGNLCHDPDDLNNKFKFNFTKINTQSELYYSGNPIIYFFGDYNACNLEKKATVNNLFVYFDNGDKTKLNSCLTKMKFNIIKGGNTEIDYKIPYNLHGLQYNDYKSRNFIISFNPTHDYYNNGFITIINTKKIIEGFDILSDFNNLFNEYTLWLSNNQNKDLIDFINDTNKSSEFILKFTSDTELNSTIMNGEDINKMEFLLNLSNIDKDKIKGSESSTDTVTQLTTDTVTQLTTDTVTQLTTDTVTQLTTDAVTQLPTDAVTQLTTDAVTQLTTDVPQLSPVVSQLPPAVVQPLVPNKVQPLVPNKVQPLVPNQLPMSNSLFGSISFDQKIINDFFINKKMCLYIKFWLASFNFIDNQIVSIDNRQGPYKSINFIGNPKIIIYIPRFNTYQKKKNK